MDVKKKTKTKTKAKTKTRFVETTALHPISYQKFSLGYVTLQHLTLQKHRNQPNCRHFSLMTRKYSQ